jgi:hypothetical protein
MRFGIARRCLGIVLSAGLLSTGGWPLASNAAAQSPGPARPQAVAEVEASLPLLDQLLDDYRTFELPFPPRDAELVKLKFTRGTFNGVQQYSCVLLWRVTAQDRKAYWIGCVQRELDVGDAVEEKVLARPTEELIRDTQYAGSRFRGNGFNVDPDLALAIQCHARGWSDVAARLLVRSREVPLDRFARPQRRSRDDRIELATMAWNHWCNEFARGQDERQAVLTHLQRISDGSSGLNTPAHRNLLADMRQTLVPPNAEAGEYAALIDALLDVGIHGGWQGRGYAGVREGIARSPECKQLRDAGLAAVPDLIDHLSDFRLTRCIEHSSRGTWHARIADVVAGLLNDFVPDEFSYDFLIEQGRGKRLDQGHVLHWWSGVQGSEARTYLTAHAIEPNAQGEREFNGAMLHALGQQYPDALIRIFEEHFEALPDNHSLFVALADSTASREAKSQLFLTAAASPQAANRVRAIDHLFKLDDSHAAPLLIKELDALPETPSEPYWLAITGPTAQLMRHTDDQQVWDALERTVRRVDLGQRMEILDEVGNGERGNERAIQFLARFLSDSEVRVIPELSLAQRAEAGTKEDLFSGPCAGFIWNRLAVRDLAAMHLAQQLDLDDRPQPTWREADWTALRTKVEQALAARGKPGGDQ